MSWRRSVIPTPSWKRLPARSVSWRGLGQTIEDSLLDFLRSKQLLLVLDNCEHLLDSVTDLVDRVVRACPRVTVLATSREGLALAGERILALRSLGSPRSRREW